ncbi:CLC_0170 family protein [Crassaminicella thermophila]|uniref:CLC_0170 family protein n=1 Tax=Crassaminicella thermophila TaxID=2599308 RepID=UPI0038CBF67F
MFFYKEMKDFYSFYVFFLSISIGLFCLFVDYKSLRKKKLKKEAKICKFIGWTYLVGNIGFYIIFKVFE